ncbi:MAG: phage holin family protein [Faecalibacterium sp.]|nr:phage holin family protein [Ruminococcus sp.]MCM1392596.1 phage holin family protein [Ruminococcus sp.]MCM1486539.1 phage holin family protein [Faecalibacterium sp.]
MKFDITAILQALIALLSAAMTSLIIPLVKNRLSQSKQEKLQFWVETAVKAAEQIYGSRAGQEKRNYVVQFLLSKGIVFNVDDVTAMIESEVYKLTNSELIV